MGAMLQTGIGFTRAHITNQWCGMMTPKEPSNITYRCEQVTWDNNSVFSGSEEQTPQ